MDAGTIELYFYGELPPPETARVAAHLRRCAACGQHLDDLRAIRTALAARPRVEAPPAGDWSGFTRRLESAIATTPVAKPRHTVVPWLAMAATLTIVAGGVFVTSRVSRPQPASQIAAAAPIKESPAALRVAPGADAPAVAQASLVQHSEEHFERSKLVVLGLATLEPHQTHAADWEHERELAGSLLPDTRLYRLAAEHRGMADLARVLGDLETVLLETSMTDHPDRESLERVQRLIARRDLVVKMNVIGSGI
jgi:hypothetical protein